MIVFLITRGNGLEIEMGGILATFATLLTFVGIKISRTLAESLCLRFEQASLVIDLRASEASMAEAQRCLHCWVNTVFEGTPQDGTMCILCGGCVDVCPERCLELVSLDRIDFSEETIALLGEDRELFGIELDDIRAEELGVISGSVMIKDETRCIRCGLCAARCPAGTIVMESYNLLPTEATGLISIEAIDRSFRSRPPLVGASPR